MAAQTDNKMLYKYTQKANQKYYPPKKDNKFLEKQTWVFVEIKRCRED
jgi:hypothetical protein